VTSRLSDRLREVVRSRPPAGASSAPEASGGTPDAAAGPSRAVEDTLGGEWRTIDAGRYFIVERRLASEGRHGSRRIGDLAAQLERSATDACLFAGGARPPWLFFDLETTGLNGGAGTLAFLIGCGAFDPDGGFVIRQYVLTRLGDERSVLQAVSRLVRDAGALVSFNGKSFDAPLLESRFAYHRLPWIASTVPHLDVLHPARRFWREDGKAGAPCSLAALERQVLDAGRDHDVPGAEAPGRYFQFIRSGDPEALVDVLEHNRLDLLSLAGLTARLLTLVREGPEGARSGREAFALGDLYERAGWHTQSHAALEQALELLSPSPRETIDRIPGAQSRTWHSAVNGSGPGVHLPDTSAEVNCFEEMKTAMAGGDGVRRSSVGPEAKRASDRLRAEVLRALARSHRRAGRYEAAALRWRQLLDGSGCTPELAREAAEALAVHHEHRRRDLASARVFALRTLESPVSSVRHTAIRHRLARLERKIREAGALLALTGLES